MARDLICSATLLGIAAGYYSLASGIGRSALSDEVGPGGLPVLYATILASLAIILAVSTLLRASLSRISAPAANPDREPLGPLLGRAAGAFGIGVGYLLIVPFAGYFLTLILAITATALYFGERVSVRLALVALAGASLFWLLFVMLLGIPMPTLWGT